MNRSATYPPVDYSTFNTRTLRGARGLLRIAPLRAALCVALDTIEQLSFERTHAILSLRRWCAEYGSLPNGVEQEPAWLREELNQVSPEEHPHAPGRLDDHTTLLIVERTLHRMRKPIVAPEEVSGYDWTCTLCGSGMRAQHDRSKLCGALEDALLQSATLTDQSRFLR